MSYAAILLKKFLKQFITRTRQILKDCCTKHKNTRYSILAKNSISCIIFFNTAASFIFLLVCFIVVIIYIICWHMAVLLYFYLLLFYIFKNSFCTFIIYNQGFNITASYCPKDCFRLFLS